MSARGRIPASGRRLGLRGAALVAAACLLAAPRARADQERGIVLTRQAQAALAAGDGERALELLAQARVEWPGSPVVANTIADAQRELGRYAEALAEYERGMRDEYAHHALFNRAVTRHRMAEQGLAEAGVPADVAALPEGPQPEMLAAVERALPELSAATEDFLQSLDRRPDPAARESVAALNRRVDALAAIADELRRRDQEQQDDQQQQGEDPQQQDQQDQEPQDDQAQDQQDPQQQDQPPQDPPDADDPQDPQDPQEPPEQEPQQGDEQPPQQEQPAQGQEQPRQLSQEEVQRLLDRLERLEQEARERQKAREAARRQPVEKDW